MPRVALDILDNPTGCVNVGPDGQPIYCPWVRTQHFGSRWFCHLFNQTEQLKDDKGVPSGDGRLQRWPECLAAQLPE